MYTALLNEISFIPNENNKLRKLWRLPQGNKIKVVVMDIGSS